MKSIIREIASKVDLLTGRLIDLQGDIAVHLASVLSALSMTQRQLANITGMTESRISKILSGDENLTLKTVVRLELATGKNLIESPMFRSQTPVIVPQSASVPIVSSSPEETYLASQGMQTLQFVILNVVASYAKSTTRKQVRV